jgi:hypothetical protein
MEPVARSLAYKRMRISVESYPLITYARVPTASGPFSSWTSFGAGSRADYRLTRYASATMDVTSSFAGGPADVHTIEVGTRIGRERSDRLLYTFVDLRAGYAAASFGSSDGFEPFYPTSDLGFRFSDGFGVSAGVGMEYALTRTFSLVTGASAMRNRMRQGGLLTGDPSELHYTMTLYRYMAGLRWNPVRVFRNAASQR